MGGRNADHLACEDGVRPGDISVRVKGVHCDDITRATLYHWGN